jgi:hypothetical protein
MVDGASLVVADRADAGSPGPESSRTIVSHDDTTDSSATALVRIRVRLGGASKFEK